MIENMIRRAMGYTGNVFAEFRNDPTHWSNNKRRLHGMGPLRKQSNRKSRKEMLPSFMFAMLDKLSDEILTLALNEQLQKMEDVRKLP